MAGGLNPTHREHTWSRGDGGRDGRAALHHGAGRSGDGGGDRRATHRHGGGVWRGHGRGDGAAIHNRGGGVGRGDGRGHSAAPYHDGGRMSRSGPGRNGTATHDNVAAPGRIGNRGRGVRGRRGHHHRARGVALEDRAGLSEDDGIDINHPGSILFRVARTANIGALLGQNEPRTDIGGVATVETGC